MKIKMLSVLAFSACTILGASTDAQNDPVFPPANNGQSTSIPASAYRFHPTGIKGEGGVGAITGVDAYGDAVTGKHGTFMKFTPGFVSYLHTHTYDYYAVVIKGEMENYEVGVKPIKMSPGSYWYQQGKKAHTTVCLSKEPCLAFVVQSQKFDAQVPPKEE